jgi:hypothetical protein
MSDVSCTGRPVSQCGFIFHCSMWLGVKYVSLSAKLYFVGETLLFYLLYLYSAGLRMVVDSFVISIFLCEFSIVGHVECAANKLWSASCGESLYSLLSFRLLFRHSHYYVFDLKKCCICWLDARGIYTHALSVERESLQNLQEDQNGFLNSADNLCELRLSYRARKYVGSYKTLLWSFITWVTTICRSIANVPQVVGHLDILKLIRVILDSGLRWPKFRFGFLNRIQTEPKLVCETLFYG